MLTGANGFVGRQLKGYLLPRGQRLVTWTRHPASLTNAKFSLGQPVKPAQFAGVTSFVHCAYDFSARDWNDIVAINVRGSEQLLRAAKDAGVARLVFISSLSAFEGCRSLYGRAKLEIEQAALRLGALVIRPGLVYGDQPGGVFGGLVKQVKSARLIPLLSGGYQPQFLVHADDLGELIARFLNGHITPPNTPITLAHETAWPMRQLLAQIARATDCQPRFVSVPWQFAWFGLKTLETFRLPAPFRSDSLIGYIYQNAQPDFVPAKILRADCRPFEITRTMVT